MLKKHGMRLGNRLKRLRIGTSGGHLWAW